MKFRQFQRKTRYIGACKITKLMGKSDTFIIIMQENPLFSEKNTQLARILLDRQSRQISTLVTSVCHSEFPHPLQNPTKLKFDQDFEASAFELR